LGDREGGEEAGARRGGDNRGKETVMEERRNGVTLSGLIVLLLCIVVGLIEDSLILLIFVAEGHVLLVCAVKGSSISPR
jgi:hypothetical protein